MKDLFTKAKTYMEQGVDSLKRELDAGMKTVKEVVNGLPVLVSMERGSKAEVKYDEKHYFIIPNYLSETGFSLHTMRSLPDDVPEVNELPKRRVFHFPNEHYEGTLRRHMLETARDMAYAANADEVSTLEKLADDIDALDTKLTYGMLVIGGIAAIFNPLIGAGIAVKAILPSISGLLVKHGLKPMGEKATKSQLENKAKEAEAHVLNQFSESTTLKVTNPILNELEFALRTTEEQHDPLHDPNLADADIEQLKGSNWRHLTELAVCNVYEDIIRDKSLHKQARLGQEDLRWLEVLLAGKMK